jgi:DNA-cytosine methyltransferase
MSKAYYNEIEPFCVAVLKTLVEKGEIPDGVVDPRDIREIPASDLRGYKHIHLFAGIGGFAKGFVDAGFPENVRICTFGFPCQDLSVAGKRGGLSASRSGLFFDAARIIGEVKPDWFICENVPGLLSSNQGKDFGIVIQTLSDLGYGLAWRILDSQYFGVAQRRRRVFIVGCLGKPCPAEILFESSGVCGNPATSQEEGPRIARETGSSLASGSPSVGTIQANCGQKWWLGDQEAFKGDYFVLARTLQRSDRGIPSTDEAAGNHVIATPIAFNWQEDRNFRAEERNTNPLRVQQTEAVCSPSDSNGMRDFAGLPEGVDSPRYKALGNAVTTKAVAWVARRIKTYGLLG